MQPSALVKGVVDVGAVILARGTRVGPGGMAQTLLEDEGLPEITETGIDLDSGKLCLAGFLALVTGNFFFYPVGLQAGAILDSFGEKFVQGKGQGVRIKRERKKERGSVLGAVSGNGGMLRAKGLESRRCGRCTGKAGRQQEYP